MTQHRRLHRPHCKQWWAHGQKQRCALYLPLCSWAAIPPAAGACFGCVLCVHTVLFVKCIKYSIRIEFLFEMYRVSPSCVANFRCMSWQSLCVCVCVCDVWLCFVRDLMSVCLLLQSLCILHHAILPLTSDGWCMVVQWKTMCVRYFWYSINLGNPDFIISRL